VIFLRIVIALYSAIKDLTISGKLQKLFQLLSAGIQVINLALPEVIPGINGNF